MNNELGQNVKVALQDNLEGSLCKLIEHLHEYNKFKEKMDWAERGALYHLQTIKEIRDLINTVPENFSCFVCGEQITSFDELEKAVASILLNNK